ncbi:1-deoxy-D-xylulose-5-phosphate synthase [Thiocystis violascens]|uniref:1-deoxy-D-xylulose-5-phosphate synthase n=1 Tax=Thiocystis violascens (strain ATCC 17096 / DSM 198 / 6111) TaxID=765911 RepID=I3Y989_THIV6|nr:1-deoxy-D-xylulose-5-phosphate synthase [Thiocystis violascens]AFL73557.1 1-deoxy-D-xylulose-5-phosphate synthase [Thiocystis violascens DSM 198]
MPHRTLSDPGVVSHRRQLLDAIDSPVDLRALSQSQLPEVASELRGFLVECVSRTGGHLAAGLGVVELTIGLHYVFDTPRDRLVWDVGHQAYPHKILTGRREQMSCLRQKGGPSGFPKRSESAYDTFGVGHSSTSISAALGMALAAKQRGERRTVVAVIGDGALGAGMAFEALNHAGSMDIDLVVILNDNEMSISPPVGAISNHLARLLSGKLYTSVREGSKTALAGLPHLRHLVGRWEEHMKGMVMPSTLFEELGFNYIGPIDGHDLDSVIKTLRNVKGMPGQRLLHVVTHKGHGYEPAEGQPTTYHGVTPFDRRTGELRKGKSNGPSYTQIFGDWLCDAAEQDPRLVGITPAMCEGSGLTAFAKRFPDRFFDVGIAEQHAVTLAAGMACEGLKPVVAIYSSFLQRAYDQFIHDVCLQDLDVTFAVDRGGLVGPDGATHAGSFDLSFCRPIPKLIILAPSNENECRRMLRTAYEYEGPAMVRYPRGCGPGVVIDPDAPVFPIGRGEVIRRGRRVALLAFGSMVTPALEAAVSLDATVANMRFVKPLDESLILELAQGHDLLVTIEENAIAGGAGSAVSESLSARGLAVRCLHLGLPDRYIEHAEHAEQLAICGLDAAGIVASVGVELDRLAPDDAAQAVFAQPRQQGVGA